MRNILMKASNSHVVHGPAVHGNGHHARLGVVRVITLIMIGFALSACANGPLSGFRNSLADNSPPAYRDLNTLAKQYDARPGERNASLAYAEALRAQGQHGQAVAVLQTASINNVGDRGLAAAYGKALSDVGRFQEAGAVLAQAHTEDRPDWQVLSAQGVVADQMGDHVRARQFYSNALDIYPNHPKILTNLALSHVLTRDIAKAEEILAYAATQPGADERVTANLVLVQKIRSGEAQANDAGVGKTQPTQAPIVLNKQKTKPAPSSKTRSAPHNIQSAFDLRTEPLDTRNKPQPPKRS